MIGPKLLLLDEGFMGSAYAAVALRDAGCDVTVLAGTGGRGGYRGRRLRWSLAPPVRSARYMAAVDEAVRDEAARGRPFECVLPLTEPIQERIWDGAPSWDARVYPHTEGWQRTLLRDKRRLAEFVGERGVAIPAHCPACGEASVRSAVEALGL